MKQSTGSVTSRLVDSINKAVDRFEKEINKAVESQVNEELASYREHTWFWFDRDDPRLITLSLIDADIRRKLNFKKEMREWALSLIEEEDEPQPDRIRAVSKQLRETADLIERIAARGEKASKGRA